VHPPLHVTLAEQLPSGEEQLHSSLTRAGEADVLRTNMRRRVKTIVKTATLGFLIEDFLRGEVGSVALFYSGPGVSTSA